MAEHAVGVNWVGGWRHIRNDIPGILGFWKDGVEVPPSKGMIEFLGSDQIISVCVSTSKDKLRYYTLQDTPCVYVVAVSIE